MSWLQKLYRTYEACAQDPDYTNPPQADNDKEVPALMPVSHVSQQAHIHVVLDDKGNFHRAELLPPKQQVVIPATEDSAARTSGYAPHPLADKIHYCAKDYKGSKENCFSLYEALLTNWCDSPHSHPKAKAVHAYISKGHLVRDLVACGVLYADDNGELLTQAPEGVENSIFSRLVAKKGLRDQGDAMVVWSVALPGDKEARIWKDSSLQQAWVAYDSSLMDVQGLCMLQGEKSAITEKHPRNIRRPGDGAKLISGNDETNFTFRGRFLESAHACTVGYEASHKAHNALRWLIARQGYRNGDQVILAWAENGEEVIHPCVVPEELVNASYTINDDLDLPEMAPPPGEGQRGPRDMGKAFALRLARAMRGYRAKLDDRQGIAILALDAAGPGRLAVTFYREQMPDDYIAKLTQWQEDFAWMMPVWRENKNSNGKGKAQRHTEWIPHAPTPKMIAQTAYGRRLDDKLRKATEERLLPCIVDGSALPRDLMEACLHRACNPVNLENWEKGEVLAVACALYKGFIARHSKEETYDMTLDTRRTSRDYLYGRLLATAHYIERTALDMANEKRPTNAERLMQRFADHPFSSWRNLELGLQPYIQRLQNSADRAGLLGRAKKVMQESFDLFLPDDFTSPAKLSGEFLLGYHCQIAALYSKTEKDTTDGHQGDDHEPATQN